MRTYACSNCQNTVYFENVSCLKCGSPLAFDPEIPGITALLPETGSGALYRRLGAEAKQDELVRYCANAFHGVCNWLAPADDHQQFCRACDLNRTIPNLSEPGNLSAWRELERAKKRLVYALIRFGLPFHGDGGATRAMTFDFVREATTGHIDGVITVDVMEADVVERERQRRSLDEPYRTLLGHLRHESGHYFWTVLIANRNKFNEFREVFGDERQDYWSAIENNRLNGAPPDWRNRYVSAYAACHPWEDWAETWAHYLHFVDAVDTADAFGMAPRPHAGNRAATSMVKEAADAYREVSFIALMDRWVPLSLAMNTLSRSIGHSDFYPFVIPSAAYNKLAFVHDAIRGAV